MTTADRTRLPQTTLMRAALALALCVLVVAAAMTFGTASSWPAGAAPQNGPEAIAAVAFVFAVWTYYVGVFFLVFAGLPWALLHLIGFRSWWIAPLAGFAVAFAIAFFVTTQAGQPALDLEGAIDGRLAPYGESMLRPEDGARNGALFGAVGAVIGLLLWRMAYRRPSPANPISGPKS